MSRIELQRVRKVYALEAAQTARSIAGLVFGRKSTLGRSGAKTALDDISLEIESGERVGIIGPNGAGKSTLLQLVAGIGAVTSGNIRVVGHVTSVLTLGVGIRDDATGRENIFLDGEIQGKSRAEIDEVLDRIVDFAELGEFIDRPVRTYSTGMKARLAFAMVTHIDPDILLIDEALSVGDAAFAAKASRRIREICAMGNIVVVVSHGLTAINEICNRCIWLRDGRIVMDGRPEEVTRAYATSVRESDDREQLQRFRNLTGASQFIDGFEIARLQLLGPDGALHQGKMRAGEPFGVLIEVDCPPASAALTLRLVAERLDGLLLFDETVRICEAKVMHARFPGALAAGAYKLSAELLLENRNAAARSQVFELVSEIVHTGGRPALAYPYSIAVETVHG